MTRDQFIAGLREAADFFEAHPDFDLDVCPLTINVFANSKEDLLARAKSAGGHWEKHVNGDYYYLTRQIGCFAYEINIQRAKVCRRIVKGTRVEEKVIEDVEWVCEDALHAIDDEQAVSL